MSVDQDGNFSKDANEVRVRCSDLLKTWGIDFMTKAIGGWSSETSDELDFAMEMKLNVLYRMDAVAYNLGLLAQLVESHNKKYLAEQFENPSAPDLIYDAQTKQMYLFDNVVFHLISLFDYLANLAAYQYCGRNATKWKWKRLMTAIRNPESMNGKYGSTRDPQGPFASFCQQLDREWIAKLSALRAGIYHYRPDNSHVSATMDLDDFSKSTLTVGTPEQFKKWFKRSAGAPPLAQESILGGGSWVVLRSFEALEKSVKILNTTIPTTSE